ncbi:MAG: F0F1 ATP synthase subunit B [Phototrophicaceae bacterium]
MQIDLFTLIAQIINFLVLLVLLRIFLYKPILDAMDTREAKITEQIEEAREKRKAAEEEQQAYQSKRRELDQQRSEILAEARQQAEQRRKELMDEARHEVDQARQRWHQAVRREQDNFLRDLRLRAGEQVVDVAQRALTDLADTDLERQMVAHFLRQIDQHADELQEAFGAGATDLTIYSTFPLQDDLRARVTDRLADHLEHKPQPDFASDDALICGIALRNEDYELGWNLQDYLSSLADDVRDQLATLNAEQQVGEGQQGSGGEREAEMA